MTFDEFKKIISLIQSPDNEVVVLGIKLLSQIVIIEEYRITDIGVWIDVGDIRIFWDRILNYFYYDCKYKRITNLSELYAFFYGI